MHLAMKSPSLSTRIYIVLVLVAAGLAAAMTYMPFGNLTLAPEDGSMPLSTVAIVNGVVVLVLYGGLGYVGLRLCRKLGYPDVWDPSVPLQERLKNPAMAGLWIGLIFIVVDNWLARSHHLGPLPHPPFPTSLVASVQAGIGEELIFRLFFVPFLVWLISRVMLKGEREDLVFWVASVFSGMFFAAGHIPSVMLLLGLESFDAIPTVVMIEIFVLNGTLSMVAAYSLRKGGFLAAATVHTTTDLVWHVIWGLMR